MCRWRYAARLRRNREMQAAEDVAPESQGAQIG